MATLSALKQTGNSVFIKNLSPLVTEEHIRTTFSVCDEILAVEFKQFPGSTQRYCQVDFKSSTGVTSATNLNGTPLLGVAMVITVIDPMGPTASLSMTGRLLPAGPVTNPQLLALLQAQSVANQQVPIFGGTASIQSAAAQAAALAQAKLQNMGLPLSILHGQSATPTTPQRETEAQQLARTICIENVPVTWTLLDINTFFSPIGLITDKKIINRETPNNKGSNRMALVEFATALSAQAALSMSLIDKTLKIGPAKTTASPRDPDNISFDLPPGAPIPVAYQQVKKLKLEEKLARVKAMSQGLSKKFSSTNEPPARKRSVSSTRSEDPVKGSSDRRVVPLEHDRPRDRRRNDRYARFFKDDDYSYRRRRDRYSRFFRDEDYYSYRRRRHTFDGPEERGGGSGGRENKRTRVRTDEESIDGGGSAQEASDSDVGDSHHKVSLQGSDAEKEKISVHRKERRKHSRRSSRHRDSRRPTSSSDSEDSDHRRAKKSSSRKKRSRHHSSHEGRRKEKEKRSRSSPIVSS